MKKRAVKDSMEGEYCFFCLKSTTPGQSTGKEKRVPRAAAPKSYSFRNLCKYLKIDAKEAISSMSSASAPPPPALDSSEIMDVQLCSECSHLLERFSKNLLEMEAARMKANVSLKSIYDRMVVAVASKKKDKEGRKGGFIFVKQLRRKTMERCSTMIEQGRPHVLLRRIEVTSPPPEAGSGSSWRNTRNEVITVKEEDLDEEEETSMIISSTYSVVQTGPAPGPSSNNHPSADAELVDEEAEENDAIPVLVPDFDISEVKLYPTGGEHEAEVVDLDMEEEEDEPEMEAESAIEIVQDMGPPIGSSSSTTDANSSQATIIRKCGRCPAEFSTETAYYNHCKSNHLRKGYKCEDCGINFSLLANLRSHLASGHLHNFPCDICGKFFARKSSVGPHKRIHKPGSTIVNIATSTFSL